MCGEDDVMPLAAGLIDALGDAPCEVHLMERAMCGALVTSSAAGAPHVVYGHHQPHHAPAAMSASRMTRARVRETVLDGEVELAGV